MTRRSMGGTGGGGVSLGARAAWALGLAVAATLVEGPRGLAAAFVLALASYAASRRARLLPGLLAGVGAFAAFALAINALATPGTPLWPRLAPLPTREGVTVGLWTAGRLAVTALAFAWLAATTRATAALDALWGGPLRLLGRTGDALGLVALVALRFGPLVASEGRRLVRAVALRADRKPGAWAATAVAVPLVTASVRRADRLAHVLEARHFGAAQRTPPVTQGWTGRDATLVLAGAAVALLAAFARRVG